jgi:hypothetical protein
MFSGNHDETPRGEAGSWDDDACLRVGSRKPSKAKQAASSSASSRSLAFPFPFPCMAGSIAIVAAREIAMDPRRLLFLPLNIIAM